jgi:hypothetical protein
VVFAWSGIGCSLAAKDAPSIVDLFSGVSIALFASYQVKGLLPKIWAREYK